MSSEIKEYYAVVHVPTKIGFRTNATDEQLTEVAHQAAAKLPSVGEYKPTLLECSVKDDGEELTTPPIRPVEAA